VITRAAVAIDRAASALDPAQAALIGFAHALELEHPDLPGVAIDLDPSRPLDEADALVAALRSDGERRIALRAGGHWVPRLVTARVAAGSTTLRADATYLITGGLGGLGMGVARWMAERGAGHVVLVGRGAATTATETLASLARGTSARIIARTADVTQRDSLAGVIDGIRDHLPPLRGIVHAAGVLDDGMLLNQSWERCERVLAPKVRGAVHLHQLSRELPLDFFVMFSSIASLLGSRGQASYLAANAVLDALAHARRAEGLPALSINWGPWAEVGMADRTAHAAATRRGIGELSPVLALDLFGRLLAPAADVAAQVGIVSVGWTDYLTRFPDGAVPPLFAEVAHATTSGHATQAPRGELTRQLAAIREDDRREALVAHVRGVVAQALGLADWHALDQGERLFALGLDSLMAVEVSQRLKTDTDHELPATLLFDYTTVNALADYLATHVYRLPAPPARMAGHASPALAGDDDLARTAASIEHLSDDAIEAMLLARLDRTVGGL
jgi:NAD(P)-dependent dehydrogenase (short-subunit alcohol dehydrogenase family)/acyl carrier protein